jgi:hypothetical protein
MGGSENRCKQNIATILPRRLNFLLGILMDDKHQQILRTSQFDGNPSFWVALNAFKP